MPDAPDRPERVAATPDLHEPSDADVAAAAAEAPGTTPTAAVTGVQAEDLVIAPVDVDGVGAVLYGTLAWTVALVLCLLLRDRLAADGRSWWTWVCLAAALLGLAGLWFVRRRAAVYRDAAG